MKKRWIEKPQGDPKTIADLSQAINVDMLLANILVQRGITNFEEAKKFFRPELSNLYDPFLMKDMDKAVERIDKAISGNEKILVYGDYDVDGTTAVSMVYSFLRNYCKQIDYYIPDRYKEGYGISYAGIDYAEKNNFTLMIALDCGIKSVNHINYANEKGIDFIICDHHLPGDTLPPANAILDPKRLDCEYPFKELSGCGIGFKLIHAYSIKHNIQFDELLSCLDLLALSIASDIVPITGENRIFTYYGLKRINENPRPGIKALIDISLSPRILDITDLVFAIGPRINAAGRVDDAKNAVRLLIAETNKNALQNGIIVDNNNKDRKSFDISITAEALAMIENDEQLINKKSTVLFQPNWHKGVIGIVASRLIEKYHRPTVILTSSNGTVTGSARSVKGFNIYNAIEACSDLLLQFGGHNFAAGLTLKPENVKHFQQKFEDVVSKTIDEQCLKPSIDIDSSICFKDINFKFYNILKQLAPFGPGNMKPVFKTDNVFVNNGNARIVKDKHLKLALKQENSDNLDAIGFEMSSYLDMVSNNSHFNVCFTLNENHWNGTTSLQLNIKDIQ